MTAVESAENDEALLLILKRLTSSSDRKAFSSVCRRWLLLHGRATTSLRLLDWSMLESGRLATRFPNLTQLDLTGSWSNSPDPEAFGVSAVFMTRGGCAMRIDPRAKDPFDPRLRIDEQTPTAQSFDNGLRKLVACYPRLRSLHVVDVFRARETGHHTSRGLQHSRSRSPFSRFPKGNAPTKELAQRDYGAASDFSGSNSTTTSSTSSDSHSNSSSPRRTAVALDATPAGHYRQPQGLEIVVDGLPFLQELVVRQCMDASLDALLYNVSGCPYLQTLHLVGSLPGFYHAAFSDRGLKKLPRCCPRLLELHLQHGDVGLEGLAAIAQGCPMLSELHLTGSTFAPDWLQALCLFPNLNSIRLEDFCQLDPDRCGQKSHGFTQSLQELHFSRSDLRSFSFFQAILHICRNATMMTICSCKGLEAKSFRELSRLCRHIEHLSLEKCPHITAGVLESVLLGLPHLKSLRLRRCSQIKESEIGLGLADVMFSLQLLKWEPAPLFPQSSRNQQPFLLDLPHATSSGTNRT